MKQLLTQEAIKRGRATVIRSMRPSRSLLDSNIPHGRYYTWRDVSYHKFALYYHTEPSLWSFRAKVDNFLGELLKLEEGSSKEYILYTARRSGNQVKIKALPRRIKSIHALHKLDMLVPRNKDDLSPGNKLATAIMDIAFLKCLFSLGSDWDGLDFDLSKAALPEEDVRVRVGNYNLLYDKIDKEWSLWMKSSITKLTV